MSTIEQKADAAVRKINVVVVYNGLTRNFAFEPHMTITAALEHAMNAFGITGQRHLMAFYRDDDSEVTPENQSIEQAGIVANTVLALRPSRVKGGLG